MNEGAASSNPAELVPSDDLLYFVADDGVRGREVWRLDTSALDEEDVIGDTNGDTKVNFADFLVLSANYGSKTENGASDGDLDANGLVDFADFLLLSANFGQRLAAVDAAFVSV